MLVIKIDGVIGYDVTVDDVRAQLDEANGQPVTVEVSSPGGSVFQGISIYNLIKNYKGAKETKIIGLAASMGSYIALATERVTAEENAVYMIHNASAFSMGDHHEMRKTAQVLESLTNILAKAYKKKTGKTEDEIRAMMDAETYLFGEEIAAEGFADEIMQTGEQEDREEAVALAKLSLEDCEAKLKTEEKQEDLGKIAALLTVEPKAKAATDTPKGAKKMTLEELLAANPEAKAEYEAKLAEKPETKPEPKKEESSAKEGVNALAISVLKSADYAAQVKQVAGEVLEGKAEASTLRAVVAVADMYAEKEKSKEAQAATTETGETPGAENEDKGIDADGKITGSKGIVSAAAQIKELRKQNGGK